MESGGSRGTDHRRLTQRLISHELIMRKKRHSVAEHANAAGAEDLANVEKLLGLLGGGAMSQVISVAAELGIPNLLARGPRMADELAGATGCHAPSLHRLMRALAAIEYCTELRDGSFALTAMGSLLQSDAVRHFCSYAIWWGRYRWPVWGNLLHSVKTGESARKLVSGTSGFEHLKDDTEAARIFNEAMAELTRVVAQGALRSYDFSGMRQIVDVGAGYGELLAAILGAYPEMRGVLFDLPHAIEGARRHLEQAGVIDRCDIVAGDFFESVPTGADGYILKTVIHDWNDEHSAAILRNCRKAAPRGARLLLLERIMPQRMKPSFHDQHVAVADLNMLVMFGGQERTTAQFRILLEAAGFTLTQITGVGLDFCLIEAAAV